MAIYINVGMDLCDNSNIVSRVCYQPGQAAN
jgi:hypothetical protein